MTLKPDWHVWTDGSCAYPADAPPGGRGHGGWAAIVEHGSDGVVLRGRQPKTTNVRMELVAVIEGLRAVPAGVAVVVHTDSTCIVSCQSRWKTGDRGLRGKDSDLWRELAGEFDRLLPVAVQIRLVVRGDCDLVHRRCHVIAGAEAKAGLRQLPPHASSLSEDDRRILGDRFRREVRAWRDRKSRDSARPVPRPSPQQAARP